MGSRLQHQIPKNIIQIYCNWHKIHQRPFRGFHQSKDSRIAEQSLTCRLMLSRLHGKQNLWWATDGHWTKWVSSSRSWQIVPAERETGRKWKQWNTFSKRHGFKANNYISMWDWRVVRLELQVRCSHQPIVHSQQTSYCWRFLVARLHYCSASSCCLIVIVPRLTSQLYSTRAAILTIVFHSKIL